MSNFNEPISYGIYKKQNVIGWGMTEKLNGVFAEWDGKNFLSKNGLIFKVPDFFKKGLPINKKLSGELWLDYGKFQAVCNAIRNIDDPNWKKITFNIFNSHAKGIYIERLNALDNICFPAHVKILKPVLIESLEQLNAFFNNVIKKGGEGLVIRKLTAKNESITDILKWKNRPDTEAIVIGTTAAKGCYAGLIGALIVEFEGKTFKLGINDIQQTITYKHIKNWLGQVVTFSYLELSSNGIPIQAGFLAVRDYE